MITPTEIRQKAERKYIAFLKSILTETSFFPLEIPFRKVKAGDDYLQIKAGLERLLKEAKGTRGHGYQVTLESRQTRRYGAQSLPKQICFEMEADYLKFIKKQKEVADFRESVAQIRREMPVLNEWLIRHPRQIITHQADWPDLLQVCRYFQQHPQPRCYIRELPIPVHTKFIEENKGILRQLLDAILPAEAIRPEETHFERRFSLRYDEPLIRLRLLDPALQTRYHLPVSDLSTPISEFSRLDWSGQRLIIIENKITFLTLPPLEGSLALFGKGFQVELLKQVNWLAGCELFYWGDLDAQGFQILSQVRSYFPQTCSLMMDQATFAAFESFAVPGTPTPVEAMPHLTPDEQTLFSYLARHNLRLEQERISHAYVVERLGEIVPGSKP